MFLKKMLDYCAKSVIIHVMVINIKLKSLFSDEHQANVDRSRIIQDASVLLNLLQSSIHPQSRTIKSVRCHGLYNIGNSEDAGFVRISSALSPRG